MSRTDFPSRVWERWPDGWSSREYDPDVDGERRRVLSKILNREYESKDELAHLLATAEELAL